MLTSNGLRLASGVTKCRILGFSISASLALPSPMDRRLAGRKLLARRHAADFGAAIAAGADAEREPTRRAEASSELALQILRLAALGNEDEAGRTPRALSDAEKSLAAQPFESGGDARAGITPALHRGKIIAELRADLADTVGNRHEIGLVEPGQQAQQGQTAKLRRHRLGERRQGSKGGNLGRTGQTAPLRIEDQDDAPLRREDRARDNRRG